MLLSVCLSIYHLSGIPHHRTDKACYNTVILHLKEDSSITVITTFHQVLTHYQPDILTGTILNVSTEHRKTVHDGATAIIFMCIEHSLGNV